VATIRKLSLEESVGFRNDKMPARTAARLAALQQAKAVLLGTKNTVGRPKGSRTRRPISPEGKARIAAAQKARWAKVKKAAKRSWAG
jgi:hypothetical protein